MPIPSSEEGLRVWARSPFAQAFAVFFTVVVAYGFFADAKSDLAISAADVIAYARGKSVDPTLESVNAHHLLFNLATEGIARVIATGANVSIFDHMHAQMIASILASGLFAALVYRLLATRIGPLQTVFLLLIMMGSAETLILGALGESFLPALAAAAWAFLLLSQKDSTWSLNRSAQLVLSLWLATALRQDAVFLVILVFIAVPWRKSLLIAGSAGALSLATYALVYWLIPPRLSFRDWLLGYATAGEWGKGAVAFDSAAVFARTLGTNLVPLSLPNQGILVLAICALLVLCLLFGPRGQSLSLRYRFGFLAFTLVNAGFYLWWQPGNIEYTHRIAMLLCIALTFGFGRPQSLRAVRWPLLAAALLVLYATAMHTRPLLGSSVHDRTAALVAREGEALYAAMDSVQLMALFRAHPNGLIHDAIEPTVLGSKSPQWDLIERFQNALRGKNRLVFVRDTQLSKLYGLEWPIDGLSEIILFLSKAREGLKFRGEADDEGVPWAMIFE